MVENVPSLETMITHLLAIAVELHPQSAKDHSLESIVKSMMMHLVILTHVKTMENVAMMDTEVPSHVHVPMDGSDPSAPSHLSTNALMNNVDNLEFVFLMHLNPMVSLDVFVLMVTLEPSVMLLLLSVLTSVKMMVSAFMIPSSVMVTLITSVVSAHLLLLDNIVNGMRPNGTLLHQQPSDSSLL